MRSRVRKSFRADSRASMLARLVSLLMAIALLVGGTLSPAIAHAREGGVEHAMEILHLEDAASAHDAQPDDDNGQSDQTGAHHHCTIAVEADTASVEATAPIVREAFVPALTRILGSFAQAPPIEPPAA